jgi:hypothetical protein
MLWRVVVRKYESGPHTTATELFRSYRPARTAFEIEVAAAKKDYCPSDYDVYLEKEIVDSEDPILFEEHDRFVGGDDADAPVRPPAEWLRRMALLKNRD